LYNNPTLTFLIATSCFLVYEIKLGTLDNATAADVEWAWRPYMNTARKRRYLSNEDGWVED